MSFIICNINNLKLFEDPLSFIWIFMSLTLINYKFLEHHPYKAIKYNLDIFIFYLALFYLKAKRDVYGETRW